MTSKERVLKRERERGYMDAIEVQQASFDMNGTALNAVDDRIPYFTSATAKKNMLERPIGFVCKSSAGRVVRLIQNYDSDIYTAEPEELSGQWRFVWSTDPTKALPFVALSTSTYNIGECCLNNAGIACASNIDNNIWDPDIMPQYWNVIE